MFPKDVAVDIDSNLVEPVVEILSSKDGGVGSGGADDTLEGRDAKRAKTAGSNLPEVHVVTAEDVENGTFQLTDVVLPMPG